MKLEEAHFGVNILDQNYIVAVPLNRDIVRINIYFVRALGDSSS